MTDEKRPGVHQTVRRGAAIGHNEGVINNFFRGDDGKRSPEVIGVVAAVAIVAIVGLIILFASIGRPDTDSNGAATSSSTTTQAPTTEAPTIDAIATEAPTTPEASPVTVPSDLDAAALLAKLSDNDVTVVARYQPSFDISAGSVTRIDPPAGSNIQSVVDVSVSTGSPSGTYQTISVRGLPRIGVSGSALGPDGAPIGPEVEILTLLLAKAYEGPPQFEYFPSTASQRVLALTTGQVDVLLSGTSRLADDSSGQLLYAIDGETHAMLVPTDLLTELEPNLDRIRLES